MDWLRSLDTSIFRFFNERLTHPFFDAIMPFFSGNAFFFPALFLVALLLLWKGGRRGRLYLLMLLLAVAGGDALVISLIKRSVGRLRPFMDIPTTHLLVGQGGSGSMPSGHAADWFAATMVTFIYYRRSLWFMLPLAVTVSFSRIYNGVHYPGDVLAGAILGAGYAAAVIFAIHSAWQWAGPKWFPIWWTEMPSLILPEFRSDHFPNAAARRSGVPAEDHWLNLGYLLILLGLAGRFAYLGLGRIELSEDEAYQWLWSRHLDLSYYSKPPLIAYVQRLATGIWGDREFAVRFFSPILTASGCFLILRFLRAEVSGKAGFLTVLALTATPLLSVGAVLMTVDPLSVFFWTAAMVCGWRAAGENGSTRQWVWVGLWMGLGFLAKYTNLFQWLCWCLFFMLWKPARRHLRRPGPYLATGIMLMCTVPVVAWNWQHNWITLKHVAADGRLGVAWEPRVGEFLGSEIGLLNPIFFGFVIAAAVACWSRRREGLPVFLFCMGVPLFLFYFLFSFHSRVYPNWIAPSVLPMFCLAAACFVRDDVRPGAPLRWLFCVGVGGGLFLVTLLHETNLIRKFCGEPLPARVDPLRRVRGWAEEGKVVGLAREKLLAEGQPVFIIGDHYGITSELSFYTPGAKIAAGTDKPLVYFLKGDRPENQFYFWPGYESRKGENAIYVQQPAEPKPMKGWFYKWLREGGEPYAPTPELRGPPALLLRQFASVTDVGVIEIRERDRVLRRIQLFACHSLK